MKNKSAKKRKIVVIGVIAIALLIIAVACLFIFYGPNRIIIDNYSGNVAIERKDHIIEAYDDMYLITDDKVSVDKDSSLVLLVDSDKHVLAKENTKFSVVSKGSERNGRISIELIEGDALITIDNQLFEKSVFEVNTPNATLSVRGTTFEASYDKEKETTYLSVEEGVVNVKTEDEETNVKAGGSVEIKDGKITENEGTLYLSLSRKYDIYNDNVEDSDHIGISNCISVKKDSEDELWVFASPNYTGEETRNYYKDSSDVKHPYAEIAIATDNYIILENLYNDYIAIEDEKNDQIFFDAIDERVRLEKAGEDSSILWEYDDFPKTIVLKDKDGNEEEFEVLYTKMAFNAVGIKDDSLNSDNVRVPMLYRKNDKNCYQDTITYKIYLNNSEKDRLFEFMKIDELKY